MSTNFDTTGLLGRRVDSFGNPTGSGVRARSVSPTVQISNYPTYAGFDSDHANTVAGPKINFGRGTTGGSIVRTSVPTLPATISSQVVAAPTVNYVAPPVYNQAVEYRAQAVEYRAPAVTYSPPPVFAAPAITTYTPPPQPLIAVAQPQVISQAVYAPPPPAQVVQSVYVPTQKVETYVPPPPVAEVQRQPIYQPPYRPA